MPPRPPWRHAPVMIRNAVDTAAQRCVRTPLRTMAKRSRPTDDGTTKVLLTLIDLRAPFEAHLRTVVRAEETLLKCRGAHDAATFDAAAAGNTESNTPAR